MAYVLNSAVPGVQQTVRAGEGDVTAAGAAQQGNHGEKQVDGLFRREYSHNGSTHRGLRGNTHIEDNHQDDAPHDLGNLIHQSFAALGQENANTQCASQNISGLLRNSSQSVHTQGGAAYIADVESQAADGDHNGQKHPQPGKYLIGDILPAQTGSADYGPHIYLSNDVHNDNTYNNKGEGSQILGGKFRRLCQEAGADGGCGHEEGRPQKDRHALGVLFVVVTHLSTSK